MMMPRCTHLVGHGAVGGEGIGTTTADDSFVVVADEAVPDNNSLLSPRLDAEDWQSGVSEMVRRNARLRQRVLAEARGEERAETTCERCILAVFSELDSLHRNARNEAELYAQSERQHALDAEPPPRRQASTSTNRFALLQQDEDEVGDDEALAAEAAHCGALRTAIAAGRAEAGAIRRERDALATLNATLDAREEIFWLESNGFEHEIEAFQDACAHIVQAADKRRRDDAKFRRLASALEQLDPDRASFDAIDAYIRTASRELAATLDDPPGSTLTGSASSSL